MDNKKLLFRFVPTMKCNFSCEYCFLDQKTKAASNTMFDIHSVDEWIQAMTLFSDYKIEIYMWGGEPFILNDTYKLLKAWTAMDHVVSGCRIDTNIYYAQKIAKLCPNPKLKLNCSYHMKYHTLEEEFSKVKMLKSLDMVGMVNFVASKENLYRLQNDYRMTVFDLINKFEDIGVFVNIAGDFAYTYDESYPRYEDYKKFILQFISPNEWNLLHGSAQECLCEAGMHFFTVKYNGDITSCIDNRIYGDYFVGTINPDESSKICQKKCPSLISYPWRLDNDLCPWSSLTEYVARCSTYRKTITEHCNFTFK